MKVLSYALIVLVCLGAGLYLSSGRGYAGDLTLPFDSQSYYVVNSWFDHTFALLGGDTNPTMTRYDGSTGWPYNGHNGIDFNVPPDTQVLAAAPGNVTEAAWSDCGGYYQRVYHAELGYSTLYLHLKSFIVTSGAVARRQPIAYSDNTGSCTSGPHLHFAARNGQTGTNNLDPYGWSGTGNDPWTFGNPPANPYGHLLGIRVGALAGGQVSVKEGTLNAGMVLQSSPVASFAVAGARIGTINSGNAYVKDGDLGSGWYTETIGATAVALAGRRIAVINNSTAAYVKEGDPNQAWILQGNGISQIAVTHDPSGLTPNRIGMLVGDLFLVREGGLGGNATLVANHVKSIALGPGRMGFIDTSNNAFVKEGINDGWALEATNVSFLSLGGAGADKRIGVVANGTAFAKEGGLSAGWHTEWIGATKIRVNSGRVAILSTSGAAQAKEGSLDAGWVLQASGVSDVQLN